MFLFRRRAHENPFVSPRHRELRLFEIKLPITRYDSICRMPNSLKRGSVSVTCWITNDQWDEKFV